MAEWARRSVESPRFQAAVYAVIILNAVLVGLETSPSIMVRYGSALGWVNAVILIVFIAEIGIRFAAYGRNPLAFFRDGWNLFDFIIVAASLVPDVGSFTTVARLARLLRVTRLISIHPELRLIITVMVRSVPSMGHVVLLMALLLYVYGVLGFHLFHRTDPQHWGSLWISLMTLFQILTLEGWVEVQEVSLRHHAWAWLYFGSFVIVAVFVVTNLFIAVVLNNLESAKAEHQAELDAENPDRTLLSRIESVKRELNELERLLRREDPTNLTLGVPETREHTTEISQPIG
jgi:voltage-gated sodium channel